jgi:Ca2+-binding RTX toxin-like protein
VSEALAAGSETDAAFVIPLVADGTDQAALINQMLATSSASVLKLPAGHFWIGSPIHVPEGKTLIGAGQGLTTLSVLASLDPRVDNRAIVLGDGAGLADLTLDGEKAGLGGGAGARIHGVVGMGVDFLVERVSVVNATGYAFWAFGNNDPLNPPASGVFRDCYAENANILFETSDADGVRFERCVGADGDGDLFLASAFHPAAASRNITFVDCEYYGAAAVIDVLANVGDQEGIVFERVHGTTTSSVNAIYIVGTARNQVMIVDSSFVALGGYALSLYNSDLLAVRTTFESATIAVAIDVASTARFAGSRAIASGDPASVPLAFGIYADGSVMWEGGAITVSGPLGSSAWQGNPTVVRASVVVQGVEQAKDETKVVAGKPGSEVLAGGDGDDLVYSGEVSPAYARPLGSAFFVAPRLDTSAELDAMFGLAGNDRLFAGYRDHVEGGVGFDSLLMSFRGASQGIVADFRPAAGGGEAWVEGSRIGGIEAIEWLEGSDFDDLLIVGGAAGERAPIFGLGGNDRIQAGRLSGSIFGGDGDDRIDLAEAQYGSLHFGEGGNDLIQGGGADDRIDGGEGDDRLGGGSGQDRLEGGDGADFIDGGDGNDVLDGGAGDDVLQGGAGNDILHLEGGGEDRAAGGEGNDVFYFGQATSAGDRVEGGEGRDAVVLQGYVDVTLGDASLTGIESISLQSGSNASFGDHFNNSYRFSVATADGNVLAGQQLIVNAQSLRAGEEFTFDGSAETDGSFLIYGGHGKDRLTGGDGVDVFFFEGQRWGPSDRVDGGDGRDALVISGGSGLTHIEFAADSFTNIESISLNNHFATDPSQKPSYQLVLHKGNVAPGGTLIVNGSSVGTGQVVGIDGGSVGDGALILFGGGGHDTLRGGAGADLIIGGAGADSLVGGAGADTFRYDEASDSAGSVDLIGDFQSGLDRIDLSRIDADTTAAGDQKFAWIGAAAFSGSAGELRVYAADGYRWIAGDTDGDGDADLLIALQSGTPPLVPGDFLL